ncbi:MAG: hypothetical protein ACI35P_15665 [Bacillus sp. (in: firmicutes)]
MGLRETLQEKSLSIQFRYVCQWKLIRHDGKYVLLTSDVGYLTDSWEVRCDGQQGRCISSLHWVKEKANNRES